MTMGRLFIDLSILKAFPAHVPLRPRLADRSTPTFQISTASVFPNIQRTLYVILPDLGYISRSDRQVPGHHRSKHVGIDSDRRD
jgi:hypothetical protein